MTSVPPGPTSGRRAPVRSKPMPDFDFRAAERRLWLEGAEAFRDLLAPDAIMALPMPRPILHGEAIVGSLDGIPRWDEITFRSVRESDAEGLHVFAYEAEGRRGGQVYRAACLSSWVLMPDGWRLIAHSQTPAPEAAG